MTTSRKHYWLQTLHLSGFWAVAFFITGWIGWTFTGLSDGDRSAVDLAATVIMIGIAIQLYKGYGFARGLGGFILTKFAVGVVFYTVFGFFLALRSAS